MKIEISEETYERLKDQLSEKSHPPIKRLGDMVGRSFFIRTVTYHLVGKVVGIVEDDEMSVLALENASWVADSGRFMNAICEGKLNEVEPVGEAYINVLSIVDFFPWRHELPKEQK